MLLLEVSTRIATTTACGKQKTYGRKADKKCSHDQMSSVVTGKSENPETRSLLFNLFNPIASNMQWVQNMGVCSTTGSGSQL
jgi:hypothetical protein